MAATCRLVHHNRWLPLQQPHQDGRQGRGSSAQSGQQFPNGARTTQLNGLLAFGSLSRFLKRSFARMRGVSACSTCAVLAFSDVLFADQTLPPGCNPTVAQLKVRPVLLRSRNL